MPAAGSSSRISKRIGRQNHREFQPLLLSVRQRSGDLPPCPASRTVSSSLSRPAPPCPRSGAPAHRQRAVDIVCNGQVREHRRHLELAHDAGASDLVHRETGDIAPEEPDCAAGRRQIAGDQVEQRGLAAAIGADDAAHLVGGDREVDLVDGADAAELLHEFFDIKQWSPFRRAPLRLSLASDQEQPGCGATWPRFSTTVMPGPSVLAVNISSVT